MCVCVYATQHRKFSSGMNKVSAYFFVFLSNAELLTTLGLQPGKSHEQQAELKGWKHDGDCVNNGLCLTPQAFSTEEPISPKVCVIQRLLAEGDLYSDHPPTHQRCITTHLQGCNIHVDRGSSERVGWDTYRHHQLKGVLIHPHGWLVLLHHYGDYSDTANLDNSEKRARKKTFFLFSNKQCVIIKGMRDRTKGSRAVLMCVSFVLGVDKITLSHD